jgi:hypothetical protein
MTCLTCASAALRDSADKERDRILRRMAAAGFINCVRSAHRASFHPSSHRCADWRQAAPEVVRGRQEWAQRKTA